MCISLTCQLLNWSLWEVPLADLGGAWGTHAPPWASKFFRFHAVFGKIWRVHAPPGGFTPPLGKILDPPLGTYIEHVSSLVLNGKLMILLICAQQKLLANCLHVIVNRKLFRLESDELNHRVYTILIQNHLVAQDSLKKYSPTCNVSVVNTNRTRN